MQSWNDLNDLSLAVYKLEVILFADDTSLFWVNESIVKLISCFKQYFSGVFDWIDHNKVFLNWSKTKFIFLNYKNIKKLNNSLPKSLEIQENLVELVSDFKLLGCTIDNNLTFEKNFKILKSNICSKLFAIKNLFFLSFDIKLHFFKTFNNLSKLYNFCLYILLKLDLKFLSWRPVKDS